MKDWALALDGEWCSGFSGDSSLDSQMEESEDLYFQNFKVEAPGGRLAVKTGSAPADCDAAIDSLTPSEILIKVRPARATEVEKKRAEKLARFARAILASWRKNKDVLQITTGNQVIRFVGVVRVLVDKTRWPIIPDDVSEDEVPQWEARHRRKMPVVYENRNPRYVRWREDDRGNPIIVVEKYTTTALEARLAYGKWPAVQDILRGLELNTRVTIHDVWRGAYRCILIEEQPIYPGDGVLPHGYSDIPYAFAPFRELPFEEPERRYRGLLSNGGQLYPLESNVLSMHTWMLAWNAWRTYKGWLKDGRNIEIIPGQIVTVDQRIGEYLEMMEGGTVPPELLQTASVIDQYIQRNSTAQGPRSADGTRSAQQVWAIQSMRAMKIETAKQNLMKMLQRVLALAAMEVEENLFDETDRDRTLTLPLPGRDKEGNDLGEMKIGPSDINGYWEGFEVSFGRRMDPAVLEQAKALMALSQNNWMPIKKSWELSGLTDAPEEWEEELTLQAIDRLPFILEQAGVERVKNWYGEDSWQYQLVMQKIMASKTSAPTQAMPGAPGVPNPGGMEPLGMAGGGDTVGAEATGALQVPGAPMPGPGM
jgi:hypothetical protein